MNNIEGRIFGYCRTSTKKQNLDRQVRNILSEYPAAIIYEEQYTGTVMLRPKWVKLYSKLRQGDVIVFDSVSRMSRTAEEGVETYFELYNRGVELVFLKEPHINTTTYKKAISNRLEKTGGKVDFILEGINQYMIELAKEQIQLAFDQAEKEVVDNRRRTCEGLLTARLNGKQIGQAKGKKFVINKKEGTGKGKDKEV